MKTILVNSREIKDDRIVTGGECYRYLAKVLRMRPGGKLIVQDEGGRRYAGEIEKIGRATIEMVLKRMVEELRDEAPGVVLAQGIPKGSKMDFIVQKGTELGVTGIIPFVSSRTVPRQDRKRWEERVRRWQKIAEEATRQCGRRIVPFVGSVLNFDEAVDKAGEKALKIILWEEESKRGVGEVFPASGPYPDIFAVIGPEGGFSGEEVKLAKEKGFESVSLGRLVLRTETAPIVLMSVIQYIVGRIGR